MTECAQMWNETVISTFNHNFTEYDKCEYLCGLSLSVESSLGVFFIYVKFNLCWIYFWVSLLWPYDWLFLSFGA